MSRFWNNATYIVNGDTSSAATPDARSTATIVGPWLHIEDLDSIGFTVKWAGGATNGAFDFETNEDNDPGFPLTTRTNLGPKAITRTADMTAANPAGAVSGEFNFTLAPSPRAKWGRLVYTRSAAGAVNGLQVGANGRGT